MNNQQCSSYRPGPRLCASGFPQSDFCRGGTCHGCGRHPAKAPACQNEDIPAIFLDESGLPLMSEAAMKERGLNAVRGAEHE